jgi:hypothetical protein
MFPAGIVAWPLALVRGLLERAPDNHAICGLARAAEIMNLTVDQFLVLCSGSQVGKATDDGATRA